MKDIRSFNELRERFYKHKSTRNYFLRLKSIVRGFFFFDGKWHAVFPNIDGFSGGVKGVRIDALEIIENYNDAYQTILLRVENKRDKDKISSFLSKKIQKGFLSVMNEKFKENTNTIKNKIEKILKQDIPTLPDNISITEIKFNKRKKQIKIQLDITNKPC